MSEMIERLIQTVASEAHIEYGCLTNPGEIVRAVLAAMEDPTDAMVASAPPTHRVDAVGQRFELLHGGPRSIYRAMIGAARAEPT